MEFIRTIEHLGQKGEVCQFLNAQLTTYKDRMLIHLALTPWKRCKKNDIMSKVEELLW
jgi:hypothetical protein